MQANAVAIGVETELCRNDGSSAAKSAAPLYILLAMVSRLAFFHLKSIPIKWSILSMVNELD